jgi:hypothetical protein
VNLPDFLPADVVNDILAQIQGGAVTGTVASWTWQAGMPAEESLPEYID